MTKNCTLYQTVDVVSKRWSILILSEVYKGSKAGKRYSEIKKSIPEITPKILSTRLKELQEEKLILKTTNTKNIPIECRYFLTESGKDFIPIIKAIKKWGLKWKNKYKHCQETNCINCNG